MNTFIIGGGELVYFLARTLLAKGYVVTVINSDRAECSSLARQLGIAVVHGDGSDPRILASAGADACDVLLAATPNDEDNLVACQLASTRFGVPQAIALANDPENEDVFRRLGVRAVSTTRILSSVIEQSAGFDEITNLIPAGAGKVNLSEVVLAEDSPVAGRPLSELSLPQDSLIACVLRNDEAIVPRGSTSLAPGDRVVLLTLPQSHGATLRAIMGSDEA